MLRIGIDLGGTKTEGIVINEAGKMLYCKRRPTPQDRGYRAILKNIHTLVLELEEKAGESCRVGIGTPGAISTRTGCLKHCSRGATVAVWPANHWYGRVEVEDAAELLDAELAGGELERRRMPPGPWE